MREGRLPPLFTPSPSRGPRPAVPKACTGEGRAEPVVARAGVFPARVRPVPAMLPSVPPPFLSASERQAEFRPASSLGKAFNGSWQAATEG